MKFIYLAQNGREVNLFRGGIQGAGEQMFRWAKRKVVYRRERVEGFVKYLEGVVRQKGSSAHFADHRWPAKISVVDDVVQDLVGENCRAVGVIKSKREDEGPASFRK